MEFLDFFLNKALERDDKKEFHEKNEHLWKSLRKSHANFWKCLIDVFFDYI